eukprot:TRINITY_DN16220_c0_g1_i4.p1 TRINITY_DN16220_c0_g1~~TRINITY_DN16220_c0_g1_i4.p1  ORF type:complete len:335 (+),score=67.91 TRINITY_DN16220_c0_g1_i4:88-1092(+)
MCIRDSINAEYGEQLQQAMVRTQVTIWKCLDVGGEVLTVGFAVFDIIMDVWIASTYYSDGRTGFFRLSLGLLGVAQVSYTFLFVFLFTPHEISNWKKAGWALVVLPFAQLVPLVVWLISMDFKTVNQLLRDLNMIKKSQPHRLENEDQLAYNIRCKLSSHIGFLVEACVEAVPQSVLQLVAMQHAGQANMLSVLSIVLSVCCLASKGYVASFSLHFRTFCFNIICFGADVVGLFATAAWLSTPTELSPIGAAWCAMWFKLAISCAALYGCAFGWFVSRTQAHNNYKDLRTLLTRPPWLSLTDRHVRLTIENAFTGTGFTAIGLFPFIVLSNPSV